MSADEAAAEAVAVPVPGYLLDLYWWAYVHPSGVRLFERQWLVNCILLGNFARLRDAALGELGRHPGGRTLQLGCVYGDLTPRLAERIAGRGELDVVDVLPIQLENLRAKLAPAAPVNLRLGNAAALELASARYERALVVFLLHEQPAAVRRATLHEAFRLLKPGGKLVVVDYHRPAALHPLRPLLQPLLRRLEPYALDLWQHDIGEWLPGGARFGMRKRTFFGGLYQLVVVEK